MYFSIHHFFAETERDDKEGQQRQIKESVGGNETQFEANREPKTMFAFFLSARCLQHKRLPGELNTAKAHLVKTPFEKWTLMCLMLRWMRWLIIHSLYISVPSWTQSFPQPLFSFAHHFFHWLPPGFSSQLHMQRHAHTVDNALICFYWDWRWLLCVSIIFSTSITPPTLPSAPSISFQCSPCSPLLAWLATAGPLYTEQSRSEYKVYVCVYL